MLQIEDAAVVFRKAQLAARTKHPLRAHATDLGGLQGHRVVEGLGAVGPLGRRRAQARAYPGQRRDHSGPHIGRSAYDPEMAQFSGVDFAQAQPIGIRMAFHSQDSAHGHAGKTRSEPFDFSTSRPAIQTMADLVGVGIDLNKFP